jgi:hypothetical protein
VRSISSDLLALPATWGYLQAEGTASGLDPEEARCFARDALEGTSFADLIDPEQFDEIDERIDARIEPAYSRCGSGET